MLRDGGHHWPPLLSTLSFYSIMAKFELPTYGKIFALGHPDNEKLLDEECYVQEKIDGSQFSFALDYDGVIHCRSKGAVMNPIDPPKLFKKSVKTAVELASKLNPGWVYRGEALTSPKHNCIDYGCVPPGGIVLYDVEKSYNEENKMHNFLNNEELYKEAARLGLIVAPIYASGLLTVESLFDFLKKNSCVNTEVDIPIEGIVIKRVGASYYNVYGQVVRGKLVKEEFKEIQKNNPEYKRENKHDVIQNIANKFSTIPRWKKAIMRMKEEGVLLNSPKDIGGIIRRVQDDINEECKEEIKEILYSALIKQLKHKFVKGIPEWYKEELIKNLIVQQDEKNNSLS